jgi:hypothetical protein
MKNLFARILLTGSVVFLLVIFWQTFFQKKIDILFVGNSYTFQNRMPQIIEQISESDSSSSVKIKTASSTIGGAALKKLWDDGNALKLLKSKKKWDYVVLQNSSLWAMFEEDRSNSFAIAPMWKDAISPLSKNIVLYGTWARKPNSNWYTDPKTSFLQNADFMQKQTDYYLKILAQKLGAKALIPAGTYFRFARQKYPNLELYNPDNTHPSLAGSYLVALLFYRQFSGSDLKNITYAPKDLNPEDAKIIREIASLNLTM